MVPAQLIPHLIFYSYYISYGFIFAQSIVYLLHYVSIVHKLIVSFFSFVSIVCLCDFLGALQTVAILAKGLPG